MSALIALVVVCLLMPGSASAAADTCTWDGSASSAWSNGANWSGCDNGGVPENGDTLIFPAGAANLTNNNDLSGLTLNEVMVSGSLYTITGNALTISSNLSYSIRFTGADNAWSIPTTYSSTTSKSIYSSANGNVVAGNIILDLSSGADMTFGTSSPSFALAVSGIVSGSTDSLIIFPDSTVSMSNTNTYTSSGTTINNGSELICNNSSCLGASTGPINMIGDAQISLYSGVTFPQDITIQSGLASPAQIFTYGNTTLSGDISMSASLALTVNSGGVAMTLSGNVSIGNSTQLTLIGSGDPANDTFDQNGGVVSGGGVLSIEGALVTLQGNNTYTGETHVNDGVLDVRHANALGSTSGNTTVYSTSTLFIPSAMTLDEDLHIAGSGASGYNGAIEMYAGNHVTISGDITLDNDATIVNSSLGFRLTLSGIISGSGDVLFTQSGSGSPITLSGTAANTYTGMTTVDGLTLELDKSNNVVAVPGDIIASANMSNPAIVDVQSLEQIANIALATLTVNGSNAANLVIGGGQHETVGGLNGNGKVFIDGTSITVNAQTDSTFGGTFNGPGNIIKDGPSAVELNGRFGDSGGGYPSAVTVNAGKLIANPQDTSFEFANWTVNGGTISGTENIGTTIMNGGIFAPGNSPGCLNVAGDLTFISSANFNVEIGGTTICTGYDHSAVSGAANLSGGVLNISSYGGFAPQAGNTFNIITAGTVNGTFNGLPNNATIIIGNTVYRINYTATAVTLTVQQILTPSLASTGLPAYTHVLAGIFIAVSVLLLKPSKIQS